MDFSTALSTWKDIDLTGLQHELDKTALELVEQQKEGLVGRKKLAEQTREFKKQPTETQLEAFKPLLKAYQAEIDALTRRSKASESAFLNAYKLLAEAPDPYPLLDAAVDQTVKVAEAQMLELESARLRSENADLKAQVAGIAGVEDRRKKAEDRVAVLEGKMDDLIAERVAAKENELNATYDERMRNYEEREKDLVGQVATIRSQLADLRTSNDSVQTRLLDASQRQDSEVVAKLGELDLVVADLERANGRVAAVERRNELLRAEIESVRSGSEEVTRARKMEGQLAELEGEAARLLRALEGEKDSRATERRAAERKVDELQREAAEKAREAELLRRRTREYHDYDEIKRELEIMKFVEFGGLDVDEDEDAAEAEAGEDGPESTTGSLAMPDPNASKANRRTGKSLEELLTAKNRRILDELTVLRVSHEGLAQHSADVDRALEAAQTELERQKKLNERLETDLLSINDRGGPAASPAPEAGAGEKGQGGLAGLAIGGGGSKSKAADGSASKTKLPAAPAAAGASQTDNSILPIVTSQRDRFRARNAELEEELRKQFDTISDLRREVKALQADNLKLYEKVRYIGSYREDASSAVAGPSSGGGRTGLEGVGVGRDDIGRYKDKYDESLNPFESFKSREAQRAIQALNPIERAVFALCRSIIGNRRARSIFVLYAASLHLLVVFSLFGSLSLGGVGESRPVKIQPI